MGPEGAHKYLD